MTYQIGGAYHLIDPVTVFAGYGTGLDLDNVLGVVSPSGPLAPEESEQIEAGVKLDFPWGMTGTLSYFNITHSNVATTDPVDPDFRIPAGEEQSEGAEIELAWQVNDNLFVQGGYAYIDAEITKSNDFPVGGRLEDVAEHQATFWGRYLFTSGPLRNLSLSVGANYVGDRAGTLSNTFELPDYVTVDLAAAYRWKNFKVELIAQNVGDEEYFTSGNDFSVQPGEPRLVFGRIGVEF